VPTGGQLDTNKGEASKGVRQQRFRVALCLNNRLPKRGRNRAVFVVHESHKTVRNNHSGSHRRYSEVCILRGIKSPSKWRERAVKESLDEKRLKDKQTFSEVQEGRVRMLWDNEWVRKNKD